MNKKITFNKLGFQVSVASLLAIFCLFGYRSTFSVLLNPMAKDLNWTVTNLSLGYALMMTVYAITAFLSGFIIDRWGSKPAYGAGAIFGSLGFLLTSQINSYAGYLFSYAFFAGIGTGMLWVSSIVSIRQWYIGSSFAKIWGLAFMGAPIAQIVLSRLTASLLAIYHWRNVMLLLGIIIFLTLFAATLLSKKAPAAYNLQPQGLLNNQPLEKSFALRKVLKTFHFWAVTIAFLTSLIGEFLIWTQLIMFWQHNQGYSLNQATNLYIVIGIAALIFMPLLGKISDYLVLKVGSEIKIRRQMLAFAPLGGFSACLLLFFSDKIIFAILAAKLFAIYWALEPGNAAAYAAAVFGRPALGKIWGLSTMICMGIGPALGTFGGSYLFELTTTYNYSILLAAFSFLLSFIIARSLPSKPLT